MRTQTSRGPDQDETVKKREQFEVDPPGEAVWRLG